MKRLVLGISTCFAGWFDGCGAKPPEKKPLAGTATEDATPVQVSEASPFALACNQKAWDGLYQGTLDEAFSALCAADQKPTVTFVKTLSGSPWDGSGDLKVYRIGQPVHDNVARSTKLMGGGSVEIPVTPESYARRSLSYAMDPALANAHGIKLVDGLKEDQTLEHEDENQAVGLLGKVKSRLLIEKDVNHQHIVIEYEAVRISGKISSDVYFVSTQMTKSIQGIKDMFSLGIAYPKDGKYVLTSLIMTKTDNKNQPGVAAEVLLKTFREGIFNVRANALVMAQREHESELSGVDHVND